MPKICNMEGVRGGEEGFPVELWRCSESGRLQVVAFNEAGYSSVEIDLFDLLEWLRNGPASLSADCIHAIRIGPDPE